MATHAEIVEWVEQHVEAPTTYGRVAQEIGTIARAVGGAMRRSPDWFTKGHLVLRADWTVNPGYTANGLGPEEAARRLEADGHPVVKLPSGVYRLANPPSA